MRHGCADPGQSGADTYPRRVCPQQKAIEQLCHEWKSKGWIVYGIHLSDSALITCQFDSFDDGKHMHFIDGGNGGYALAAKTLKSQLKER